MFKLRQVQSSVSSLPTASPLVWHGGEIELRGVNFAYPSAPQRQILQDLHLQISPGQKVALVGSSGSGKSTVYRLLYRFYDPCEGDVLIDGQSLRDVELDSIRTKIAVVPQDTVLFNESLLYNIQYGNLHATEEQIAEVLRLARLDELVKRLPQGLQTKVGERGLKLSGGEKQRVAIARCLLKNAPIVILDEATSALDTETEASVQQALQVLGRDQQRTLIIIAHRLSTVQDCDVIYVLEQGRVVEKGQHEELLARSGRYAELVMRMSQP